MGPENIFIFRHGQSVANIQRGVPKNLETGDYYKDADVPLTDTGIRQTLEMGKVALEYCQENNINLNNAIMFMSNYKRAIDSGYNANESLGIKDIRIDSALRERSYGLDFFTKTKDKYQRKKVAEVKGRVKNRTYEERYFVKRSSGESLQDVTDRIIPFIHNLLLLEAETIFISTHGVAGGILAKELLGQSISWYFANKRLPTNGSIRLLKLQPKRDLGYIYEGEA